MKRKHAPKKDKITVDGGGDWRWLAAGMVTRSRSGRSATESRGRVDSV